MVPESFNPVNALQNKTLKLFLLKFNYITLVRRNFFIF
jgi:hypothetical protein